jgi:hypothetical protein
LSINIPQPPHPGELITASFMAEIVAALGDLDGRVTKLETPTTGPKGGAIVIDSVTPSTCTEGDTITIAGQNFGAKLGDSEVTFDGVPPASISLFSDNVIACVVPSIPGLAGPAPPPNGIAVNLEVTDFVTSANRVITVKPATQHPTGSVALVFGDASPDPVTAGVPGAPRDNDFKFSLTSNANLHVDVTLVPTLTGAPWSHTLLDDQKHPLPAGRLTVEPTGPGRTKDFYVRVSIPNGTNGTPFALQVSGTTPGLPTASTGNQAFVVGQFADPDTTFTLAPTGSTPASALNGSVLVAQSGGGATPPTIVDMDAEFTVADDYTVTMETSPAGAPGWTTAISTPAADAAGDHVISVSAAEVAAAGGAAVPKTLEIRVRPASPATAPIQLSVVVKGASATASRTQTLEVHPA